MTSAVELQTDPGSHLATLRLLQICSPAFPIGAFAYSQGLEQAIERGFIASPQALETWLRGVLTHNLAATDLPLLARAMQLWADPISNTANGNASAVHLCQQVLSYRETSELRVEERHLGRALARVLAHLGLPEAREFVEHPDASYVVLFGLAAQRFGVVPHQALSGFAFSWLENQLAAASRLMRLGQLAAQAVLSALLQDVSHTAGLAFDVADDALGFAAPGFSLLSSWHEEQYSRLFRS